MVLVTAGSATSDVVVYLPFLEKDIMRENCLQS